MPRATVPAAEPWNAARDVPNTLIPGCLALRFSRVPAVDTRTTAGAKSRSRGTIF